MPLRIVILFLASCAWALNVKRQTYVSGDPGYNCVPGMSCWPTNAEWQSFNESINGNLYATVPWAQPCFGILDGNPGGFDFEQCKYISDHYTDQPPLGPQEIDVGRARAAQYGSMMNLQWETCGASDCLLQSAAPTILLPILRQCSLGRLSAYYVDVREASDVVATINFCKEHNIRMSIKNTGSDYVGRSASANSLALWTHNLGDLQFDEEFTAFNCPSANTQNVGIMGAGVLAMDAETFFTSTSCSSAPLGRFLYFSTRIKTLEIL